jgi:hypothetical protein
MKFLARCDARRSRGHAFSLVELIVVIGIIALLIGMLMPALRTARLAATSVACKSNLHEIGLALLMYANNNKGVLFPIGGIDQSGKYRTLGNMSFDEKGKLLPREGRWPVFVFDPPVWNPRVLRCPQDTELMNNPTGEEHSYLLNHHLEESPDRAIRYGGSVRGQIGDEVIIRSYSECVWVGEKVTSAGDYYMEKGDFDSARPVVEKYRHGIKLGSNYLYLDEHVDTVPPKLAAESVDPWSPLPGDVKAAP